MMTMTHHIDAKIHYGPGDTPDAMRFRPAVHITASLADLVVVHKGSAPEEVEATLRSRLKTMMDQLAKDTLTKVDKELNRVFREGSGGQKVKVEPRA